MTMSAATMRASIVTALESVGLTIHAAAGGQPSGEDVIEALCTGIITEITTNGLVNGGVQVSTGTGTGAIITPGATIT